MACFQYLAKGSKVCVEGSIKTDEWEDKEGNKQRMTKIKAQRVTFLSPKIGSEGGGKQDGGLDENNSGPDPF